MALSSTVVWEVRADGSDLNGGGFNTSAGGTDYSQQAAAQFSDIDLASSNGTSSTPSVTSASHTFISSDVGNLINISAGTNWTTGCYEIMSVSAGAATLDRACGSAASLTSGTWKLGGAHASIGFLGAFRTTSNDVWVRGISGTINVTTSSSNVAGGPYSSSVAQGTSANYGHWRGYYQTRWNTVTGPAAEDIANPPLVQNTSGAGSFYLFLITGSSGFGTVDNISFDSASQSGMTGVLISGKQSHLRRVTAINADTPFLFVGCTGYLCTATGGTSYGYSLNGNCKIFGCLAIAGHTGFNINTICFAFHCISATMTNRGFELSNFCGAAVNCATVNHTTDGFYLASSNEMPMVNCVAYSTMSVSDYLTGPNEQTPILNCAGRAVSTNFTSNAMIENYQTIAYDPWIDGANNNFALNGSASTLRRAALPQSFPSFMGLSGSGYGDIGPWQHSGPETTSTLGLPSILGQSSPAASTLTTVYTVPISKATVVGNINVCNTNTSVATFRINVEVANGPTTTGTYLYYDMSVGPNETWSATLGVTLSAVDSINVYASATGLAFGVYGVEVG